MAANCSRVMLCPPPPMPPPVPGVTGENDAMFIPEFMDMLLGIELPLPILFGRAAIPRPIPPPRLAKPAIFPNPAISLRKRNQESKIAFPFHH